MRVAYIANHDQANSNDDEGAVADALRSFGHDVRVLHESDRPQVGDILPADLVLWHKWDDWTVMDRLQGRCVRAFWYFDLVDWPGDPSIEQRCRNRIEWMERTVPRADVGFCTDGDWVLRNERSRKLIWLTQGADQRKIGRGADLGTGRHVLFTGTRKGGKAREAFVDAMSARWGGLFRHVPHGVHGRELADLIATATIVVAPPSPVTDLYCSNRAVLTMGLGGFLLHPRTNVLAPDFEDGRAIVYYGSVDHLHLLIDRWMSSSWAARMAIADAGCAAVAKGHTYLHRVASLMNAVQCRFPGGIK